MSSKSKRTIIAMKLVFHKSVTKRFTDQTIPLEVHVSETSALVWLVNLQAVKYEQCAEPEQEIIGREHQG